MSADINQVFCTAQNVFGNGTTVGSTDWINMKVAQDNAGGRGPVVEIIVTTTFTGGTSGQFQLVACDSAGANPVVLDETPAIVVANLTAPTSAGGTVHGGTVLRLRMDPKSSIPGSTLSYLRVQCVNVGNNTAGAITAHLVPEAATTAIGKDYDAGW